MLQAKQFAQTLTARRKNNIDVANTVKKGFDPQDIPFHALTDISSQTLMDFGINKISQQAEYQDDVTG